MDFALALPTLSVVFGSRFGGGGGCTNDRPWIFLGSVEAYWRGGREFSPEAEPDPGEFAVSGFVGESATVTTVRETRSPDFRMRLTTFSWLA